MSHLDDFVFNCVNSYEQNMEEPFTTVKTVKQLEFAHVTAKEQVYKELPKIWRETLGHEEMPKNVRTAVSSKLDLTFQLLQKHFENDQAYAAKQFEKTLCENAVTLYMAEMDKFLEKNENCTKSEFETQHELISQQAISKALEKVKVKLKVDLQNKIMSKIESCYRRYVRKLEEMQKQNVSNIAIGIDLGTTMNCAMVCNKDGVPELIYNLHQGHTRTTPSYVSYHEDGSTTFGWLAKEQAFMFPECTIYDAKRMIGRSWHDANLQRDRRNWPFQVVNDYDNPKIMTWGRSRYPHEVSAHILAQFRAMAEKSLNLSRGTLTKAVVTVPAYFTETQRRATCDAAKCAGLDVLNILSEPCAAAIAFNCERKVTGDRTVLIYDLGGGTFDVAIAKISDNKVDILVVDGDTHLGCQDVDNLLIDYCIQQFDDAEDVNLRIGDNEPLTSRNDKLRALSRIKPKCETAKEQLSVANQATVFIDMLVDDKDMDVTITREKLNKICMPVVDLTMEIVARAIEQAKLKGVKGKHEIDDVILVGGSTRLLLVQNKLGEYFGKRPYVALNPDEAVAYGAAIQAATLARNVETGVRKQNVIREMETLDVVPLPVGIEVLGERFAKMIEKNERIPCQKVERFVTSYDNQTEIKVSIYQGENETITGNQLLGEFTIEGLPAKKAQEEAVDVTMTINRMGMLQVEAVSVSLGKREGITITSDRLGMDMVTMQELKRNLESIKLE